jgi:hypothetical protein
LLERGDQAGISAPDPELLQILTARYPHTALAVLLVGPEAPAQQLNRLLDAHEAVLQEARPLARRASDNGDDGTNDLIVSHVVRLSELQSWFISEHLAVRVAG